MDGIEEKFKFRHLKEELNPDGTFKHIIKEGARYHVLSWDTQGRHCSEPNCEINKKEN